MTQEFLDLILALVVIITTAKLFGYVSVRFGQPSVLGELLAGIILGPTVFDIYHNFALLQDGEHIAGTVVELAEFGVLFLMMLAGLELHLSELLHAGKVAAYGGTLGVLVPLGLGYLTSVLFDTTVTEALFIGLALSATSVSISAQTLMELNVLRSRVGLAMLGAAVFDDVLVILLLSIASIFTVGATGGNSVWITILQMGGFLIGGSLLGFWLLPRLAMLVNRLRIYRGMLIFAIIMCLLYSWAAETLGGVAGITGAFLVGLLLGQTPFKSEIESGMSALAYGFFVPIFFVNIGLGVNLLAISGSAWIFAIVLTIVAIASKIIGSGAGGRFAGLPNRESLQLGIGMVSRGEVGLIVAAFAVTQGALAQEAFSITVFMVIVATLVTPPLLRAAFRSETSIMTPESEGQLSEVEA